MFSEMVEEICKGYRCDLDGLHGLAHWKRVEENALKIAEMSNISSPVLSLFAYIHDAKRFDDGIDPDHGKRAAQYVLELMDNYFTLTKKELSQLVYACEWHTHQIHHEDPIIGICWDADRLDLGRVGIKPDPQFLNLNESREMLNI